MKRAEGNRQRTRLGRWRQQDGGIQLAGLARRASRLARWVRGKRWLTFGATVLLYALALPPLAALYHAKSLPLLGALGAGLVGFVFVAALLALGDVPLRRIAVHGLVVGLILGELAWAISYWSVVGLVGGALLWLAFYVLAGLCQAHLEGALDRRIAVEYAIVSTLGLAILLSASPWQA